MGVAVLTILLLQAPGDGWALTDAPAREVRTLYWSLFDTTELWLTLLPEKPAPRVRLVFQAFYPGRTVEGSPGRLAVRALVWWQPPSDKWIVVSETSLRFVVDGKAFDLTGPGRSSSVLKPCDDCLTNGVAADLDAGTLATLAGGAAVEGRALGFPFQLSSADRLALAAFAAPER